MAPNVASAALALVESGESGESQTGGTVDLLSYSHILIVFQYQWLAYVDGCCMMSRGLSQLPGRNLNITLIYICMYIYLPRISKGRSLENVGCQSLMLDSPTVDFQPSNSI